MDNVVKGTVLKLHLNIYDFDPEILVDYVDFSIKFFVKKTKSVAISKSEMTLLNNNNYFLNLDTSLLDVGRVTCELHADMPDAAIPSDKRKVIIRKHTTINIVS